MMMPKTEGFRILDEIAHDKAENAARLHIHNVVRSKLADISNHPQNQRQLILGKSHSTEKTIKEYIDQLQKEKNALVKMLAQSNKLIEHNGIEVDRLRVNLIKMHEQNQQLVLSNNQMLVELNLGKDRLKMLQHELGCKTGLLKAKKMDIEGKEKTKSLGDVVAELIKSQEEMESSKEGIEDEKPHETTRNLQPKDGECRSEQVESKDRTEDKRPLLRRQSARFNAAKDLFDTNMTGGSASPSQLPEDSISTSESASVKNEGSRDGSRFGRSSLGRPSRAAAKKVRSYKEVPITVKLRR